MNTFLTSLILALTLFGKVSDQASTLLDFPVAPYPELYSRIPLTTLDASGHMWVVAKWKVQDKPPSQVCVTRIKPNGKTDLERVPVYQGEIIKRWEYFKGGKASLGWDPAGFVFYNAVCDRWGNLYLGFATTHSKEKTAGTYSSTIHPTRVSPQGEVKDYYPWPKMEHGFESYMEILPGDTLILIGRDAETRVSQYYQPARISKALIDSTGGLTPVYEKTFHPDNYPQSLFWYARDYSRIFFDWNRGIALRAYILTSRKPVGPEQLTLLRLDLRGSATSITQDSLGTYTWRDYVWRTYKDAWIGWMTFVHHKGGGYLLCIPDPKDRSITHVLRLDSEGEPIDPATLENGGAKSPLNFDRRPSSAEPLVDFRIWNKPAYKEIIRDSAHVLFWGCDDEGNLYAYRQVRKY